LQVNSPLPTNDPMHLYNKFASPAGFEPNISELIPYFFSFILNKNDIQHFDTKNDKNNKFQISKFNFFDKISTHFSPIELLQNLFISSQIPSMLQNYMTQPLDHTNPIIYYQNCVNFTNSIFPNFSPNEPTPKTLISSLKSSSFPQTPKPTNATTITNNAIITKNKCNST